MTENAMNPGSEELSIPGQRPSSVPTIQVHTPGENSSALPDSNDGQASEISISNEGQAEGSFLVVPVSDDFGLLVGSDGTPITLGENCSDKTLTTLSSKEGEIVIIPHPVRPDDALSALIRSINEVLLTSKCAEKSESGPTSSLQPDQKSPAP